jgi:hypothetical protein
MTQLFVIRHAEKVSAGSAVQGMHAGLTKKGRKDALSFGKLMNYILEDKDMTVMHSKLERCRETADIFKRGYGSRAKVVDPGRRGGRIAYLAPEMIVMSDKGGLHSNIVLRSFVGGSLSGFFSGLFSMFESDYAGTTSKWLGNGFNGKLIPPHVIASAIESIAGIAKSEMVVMFVSDVQISAASAVYGISRFAEKRPDYLTGLWNQDFPSREWSLFLLASQTSLV